MAWENRGNQRVYIRKRRIGRRVVSEYMGAGYLAEAAAERDAIQRQAAAEARLLRDRQREEIRVIDAQLDRLQAQVKDLVTAVLLANGYHQHKGQWRKVRDVRRTDSN